MTKEFFNSLAHLCNYYGFAVPACDLPFPKNIYTIWQEIAEAVKAIDGKAHLIIAQHKRHKAVLTTVSTFDLKNGLYYIPVRPYWNLLNYTDQKPLADLVTVIFAHLYQVIGIPFYVGDGSYMEYQYDILEEWMREAEAEGDVNEEAKEWRAKQEDTLYEMKRAGGHIMPTIKDPRNMERMEKVVKAFHQADDPKNEWELLGIGFLQLYRQYPKRSLSDSIHADLIYPEEEDRISYDQYASFYWSDFDCFEHDLLEMINNDLQEKAIMDEPTVIRFFDTQPKIKENDHDFETRLFDLIERLRYLLNTYDHEEHHASIQ